MDYWVTDDLGRGRGLTGLRCRYSPSTSSRLLCRDGREGGPALLDVVAATARACGGLCVVLAHGEGLGEDFVATLAEVFVVGHGNLLRVFV